MAMQRRSSLISPEGKTPLFAPDDISSVESIDSKRMRIMKFEPLDLIERILSDPQIDEMHSWIDHRKKVKSI